MRVSKEGRVLIQYLLADCEPACSQRIAEKAVALFVKVELQQNEYDALVSLVMAIGVDEFRHGGMVRLLNDGDMIMAARQFIKYIYDDDDKEDAVLSIQRDRERSLFTKPQLAGGKDVRS